MTKRDKAYLRIINTLSRTLAFTIADCNAYIAQIETQANIELERLTARQIEADKAKIDTVLQSADALWQELQEAEARVRALQGKLKVKKRLLKQE